MTQTITNLITTPSFEVDTAGWSGINGTLSRVTTVSRFGSAAARYESDTSTTGTRYADHDAGASVTEGQTYTSSGYALGGSTFTHVRLDISWRDAADSQISVSLGTEVSLSSTWQRVSNTATAPAGAVTAQTRFVLTPDPGSTAAHAFVDAAMLTEGGQLLGYGDGDTPGWHWTGTPHASTSSTGGQWATHVSVDTAVVALGTVQTATQQLVVKNSGANAVDLGASGVTAGAGFLLDSGEHITVPVAPGDVLYGVFASGTTLAILST